MSKVIRFIERRAPKPMSIEMVFSEIKNYLNSSGNFTITGSIMPYGFGALAVLLNLIFFKKERADVYHITGDVHYIALRLPVDRTVITVHDAVLLNTRSGLRRYILKKLYYDLPLSRAKYITVISEKTKLELIEKTQCDPEKIRVILNPMRETFQPVTNKVMQADTLSRPVILQVGTRSNKNLTNLILAVKDIDCKLRIIGTPNESEIGLLREYKVDFSYAADLSDDQMRSEYQNADIVAFCSTYEGFGMPILEAQSMKIPLVTSDLEPMKGVAGAGALLADPKDPNSIRSALSRIINEPRLRHELVKHGSENLKKYSLESIGKQYEKLYSEIINAG